MLDIGATETMRNSANYSPVNTGVGENRIARGCNQNRLRFVFSNLILVVTQALITQGMNRTV